MLDKTSKKVLKYMNTLTNYEYLPKFGSPLGMPYQEFCSAIDYLESQGYVTTERGHRNCLIKAMLTHKGKHYKEFHFHMSFDIFVKSIFCPIVVSIIVNALVIGLRSLL